MRAPEKGMRRDDVRRFCLPCSEVTGRLVERLCPAAERVSAKKAERRKKRSKTRARKKSATQQRGVQAKREAKSAKLRRVRANMRAHVDAVDNARGADYLFSGIDLQAQLDHLLTLSTVPRSLRVLKPKLHLRNCEYPPRKWGFAAFRAGRGYLSISIWPGIGPGAMLGHLCHELAHLVAWHECVAREPHGPDWRKAYVALAEEAYGVRVSKPVANHRSDLDDVVTLALSGVGRGMMKRAKEAES